MKKCRSETKKDAETLTRRYTTTVCEIMAGEKTRTAKAAVRATNLTQSSRGGPRKWEKNAMVR